MKYSPVRVSTIKTEKSLTFDLHLFFRETYVVYKKKGDTIEKDKIKKLRKQKVGKFFIDCEDEVTYQQYLDDMLAQAMTDPNMALEDKAEVVSGAIKSSIESMRGDPMDKAALRNTKAASKGICEIVKNNPGMLKEMYQVESDDDVILQSAVNTSALVVRMAYLKKIKEGVIHNMSTACLLRDIGIVQMDTKYHGLFAVPLEDYTNIEQKIYKTHPELGKSILEKRGDVPPEVIGLVYTHEAKLQGNGFPQDIKKLTKEQAIISLCGAYDRLVTCLKRDPKEALKSLSVDELGNYDLNDIKLLKKILKEDGVV